MKINMTVNEFGSLLGMNDKLYTKKQVVNAIYNLQIAAEESHSGLAINILDSDNIEIDIAFSKVHALLTMPTQTGDTLYSALTSVFNDWYISVMPHRPRR